MSATGEKLAEYGEYPLVDPPPPPWYGGIEDFVKELVLARPSLRPKSPWVK